MSGRGHDDDKLALFGEGQGAIPDFAAWNDEVKLRTEDVLAEVVDLYEVGGDDGDLCLRAGHPDSLDDVVVRVKLRVKHL